MNKKLTKLLLIAGISAATIYGTNKVINIISKKKKDDDKTQYHTMNWRYGKINYQKKGTGSPVLLIHDIKPYASLKEWKEAARILSKSHCVYTIDLLGCGSSEKPNLTYTNYMFVQLVTDFIKNIIGEKTNIVAAGESGAFTIMACNMYPQYFDKIILLNPRRLEYLAKIPVKSKNILKHLIDSPFIGTFLYNIMYTKLSIKNLLMKKKFTKNHFISDELISNCYLAAHEGYSMGKYLHASIQSHYTNINISTALKKLNHSISIIIGNDLEGARQIINGYIEVNPSIEYTLIEKTANYPHIEKAKEFAANVEIYLS